MKKIFYLLFLVAILSTTTVLGKSRNTRVRSTCFYRQESEGWKVKTCCQQIQKYSRKKGKWIKIKNLKCRGPKLDKCGHKKCVKVKVKKLVSKKYTKMVRKQVEVKKRVHYYVNEPVKKFVDGVIIKKVPYKKRVKFTNREAVWKKVYVEEEVYFKENCDVKRERELEFVKSYYDKKLKRHVKVKHREVVWQYRSKRRVHKRVERKKLKKIWTGKYIHKPGAPKEKNCYVKDYKYKWEKYLTLNKHWVYEWCLKPQKKGWRTVKILHMKLQFKNANRWEEQILYKHVRVKGKKEVIKTEKVKKWKWKTKLVWKTVPETATKLVTKYVEECKNQEEKEEEKEKEKEKEVKRQCKNINKKWDSIFFLSAEKLKERALRRCKHKNKFVEYACVFDASKGFPKTKSLYKEVSKFINTKITGEKKCFSTGDPHVQSFYGRQINLYNVEERDRTLYQKGALRIGCDVKYNKKRWGKRGINSAVYITYGTGKYFRVHNARNGKFRKPKHKGLRVATNHDASIHRYAIVVNEIFIQVEVNSEGFIDVFMTAPPNKIHGCKGDCCSKKIRKLGDIKKIKFPSACYRKKKALGVCKKRHSKDDNIITCLMKFAKTHKRSK